MVQHALVFFSWNYFLAPLERRIFESHFNTCSSSRFPRMSRGGGEYSEHVHSLVYKGPLQETFLVANVFARKIVATFIVLK